MDILSVSGEWRWGVDLGAKVKGCSGLGCRGVSGGGGGGGGGCGVTAPGARRTKTIMEGKGSGGGVVTVSGGWVGVKRAQL